MDTELARAKGRPPIDDDGAKGDMLKIRLSAEERAALDAMAQDAGEPTSTLVRNLAMREVARWRKRQGKG